MSETQFDLDDISRIALTGINRAYVFLGLGINLVNDDMQHPFHLSGGHHMMLVPEEVSDETYADFKTGFGQWIVGNGLRELIENFEVYLDNMYCVLMKVESWAIAQQNNGCDGKAQTAKFKSFKHLGVTSKFQRLKAEFSIESEFEEELDSIKRARNCITHRLGIVGVEDLKQNQAKQIIEQQLIVKWRAAELYGHHPDGSEYISPDYNMPIAFPLGSSIKMRFPQKQRAFNVGEILLLSPAELHEICFCFRMVVGQMHKSIIKALELLGVVIDIKEPITTVEVPEAVIRRAAKINSEAKIISIKLDF
ncbi:hypothetical protein [Vampirovibrio sp.]|uniref:hypothetical protein n=1 Tax=Vampirovibrio sp. TaxID=2717857 RepID=UPI003593E5B8